MVAHSEHITTLLDVVLHIVIHTFVGKLCQSDPILLVLPYFSFANCSSKSYKSRDGGSSSFNEGGNTAACNAGIGVSNVGGIRVKCSCLTSTSLYKLTVSGTKFVSNLNKPWLNSFVKSLGSSSDSYKHDHKLSESADVSGVR